MDMKPESDRYQAIITQLALLMDRVHYLTIESRKIQQNTLYFDGYFDGLRYAMSANTDSDKYLESAVTCKLLVIIIENMAK